MTPKMWLVLGGVAFALLLIVLVVKQHDSALRREGALTAQIHADSIALKTATTSLKAARDSMLKARNELAHGLLGADSAINHWRSVAQRAQGGTGTDTAWVPVKIEWDSLPHDSLVKYAKLQEEAGNQLSNSCTLLAQDCRTFKKWADSTIVRQDSVNAIVTRQRDEARKQAAAAKPSVLSQMFHYGIAVLGTVGTCHLVKC